MWVNFYVDKHFIKSSPPYTVYWNSTTVSNGTHTIAVNAYNSSSTLVGSQSIGVTVSNGTSNNSGAVTISSPSNGSTLSGDRTISLSMSSSAAWANLYIDSRYIDSTPPLSFDFPTTKYSNGSHSIAAKAYNSSGSLLGSASITVNISNSSSGKAPDLFSYLGPGSSLPSGSTCSGKVYYTSWEPRSQNTTANHTVPTSSQLQTLYADASQSAASWAIPRVTGSFTGTTDEVLQWGSCKWGLETDVVRAIAQNETGWLQSAAGDIRTTESLCPPGTWNGTNCATSYGIMQVKYPSFHATWPMSHTSTPFNVDYALGYERACIEGKVSYLKTRTPTSGYPTYPNGTSSQMLWGCIGSYYSGGWYDSGALLYISHVKDKLAAKAWLSW
jgi:autotransporter family porin